MCGVEYFAHKAAEIRANENIKTIWASYPLAPGPLAFQLHGWVDVPQRSHVCCSFCLLVRPMSTWLPSLVAVLKLQRLPCEIEKHVSFCTQMNSSNSQREEESDGGMITKKTGK